MKQIILKNTALLFLAGTLFFSCVKTDEKPDLDTNTTSDNANSQSMFDDMAKVSEDALAKNGAAKMSTPGNPIGGCATVDYEVLALDSTKYTIVFSGGGCNDGKIRSGTIIAIMNGVTYNTPGSVLTLTTSDYTVNGNKIEGKKIITCVSNVSNNPVHDIVVSDIAGTGHAKLTYANSETATWKSKRTRSLVEGGSTPLIITDNKYDISVTPSIGNPVAEGVNRKGKSYTVDIVSPIRIDFNCFANNTARYPTQGVLKLIPDGKIARSIDYGDGTCDNKVQVIIGGKTYDVTLAY